MNRLLHFLAGPEVILAVLTAAVFAFCARHDSYSSADVRVLERLVWLLPVLVVAIAFASVWMPAARTWWSLGRVNLAVLVCLVICGFRIVNGFGAPGSGPKGQDAGIIVILTVGVIFCAVGNAIAGALILRTQSPAFAEWSRSRPFLAPVLTGVAAVPLAVAQTIATGTVLGIAGGIFTALKR